MITKICTGRRPSRPRNPSENRWLPDAVWDIITIGWRAQGNQRCKLFAIYLIFALSNIQEVQNFEPNEGNRTPQTLKRRLGKMRPRIALPLESLQNWESEIQRQVNEMNEVGFPISPLPKADTTTSVLRTAPHRTRSGQSCSMSFAKHAADTA